MNEDTQDLEQAIIEQLKQVIDPETGVDVWRMRLGRESDMMRCYALASQKCIAPLRTKIEV